jgi:hypothetical protein
MPSGGCPGNAVLDGNLRLLEGYWEPKEKALDPPVSLLSWLIRNAPALRRQESSEGRRGDLLRGDPAAVEEALLALRSRHEPRAWYIFEGPTCPDAFLVTPSALVVVEGKRTEPGATIDTTWLNGRHQIWRHIDAAWEIRGTRAVYGFFIVEGAAADRPDVPPQWSAAATDCLSPGARRSSFPHRSADEVTAISRCFLGVTTWQQVCARFSIDWQSLPDEVS